MLFIAYDCNGINYGRSWIIAFLILYFQFIMEEYCILPEGGFCRIINISKQTTLQFLSGLRVQPGGFSRFYDDCSEQTMNIGAILAAGGITHVVKEINSLFGSIPGIGNRTGCRSVFVVTNICSVRCLYIVIQSLHMDG